MRRPGATVFLASAIKEFTDQLAAYSGILTQDVEHLAPTLQPVIPGADLAGQAQGKAESTVEIEGVTTTACPTQQVNRLKALTSLLEQENPESEIYKLSGQVQEMLSEYQKLIEE